MNTTNLGLICAVLALNNTSRTQNTNYTIEQILFGIGISLIITAIILIIIKITTKTDYYD